MRRCEATQGVTLNAEGQRAGEALPRELCSGGRCEFSAGNEGTSTTRGLGQSENAASLGEY